MYMCQYAVAMPAAADASPFLSALGCHLAAIDMDVGTWGFVAAADACRAM